MGESVYWLSWLVPFTVVAGINSILGAFTAILIENVHAFQHISFVSIFFSFFFLNFGLLGASFLLVGLAGSSRSLGAICALLMVLSAFVPYIVVLAKSGTPTM